MKKISLITFLIVFGIILVFASFKTISDQNTVIVRYYEAYEGQAYTVSQIIIQDNESKIIELKRCPPNPAKANEITKENLSAFRNVLMSYINDGYKIQSTNSISGFNYFMVTTCILTK